MPWNFKTKSRKSIKIRKKYFGYEFVQFESEIIATNLC